MICERFGWSWEYLHREIPFNKVQKIMVDSPKYEKIDDNDDDENPYRDIKEETVEDLAKRLNSIFD